MKQSVWASLALVAGFALISGAQYAEAQTVNTRMELRVQAKEMGIYASTTGLERSTTTALIAQRVAERPTMVKRFGLFLREFFGFKTDARIE
ncbi:MAG: hypothetical protein Q8L64_03675 [bacterium]|nr:hypothetical protein [bacterium]